jgi:hypothetical protein
MPVMIQLRNVPDAVHRTLKSRAAKAGLWLSDYLGREVAQLAAKPTWDEMTERLRRRKPTRVKRHVAEIIREARDSR